MVSETWKHDKPVQESDCVRPTDVILREKLNKADSYGNGKLQCEEVLMEARRTSEFPFVRLRYIFSIE